MSPSRQAANAFLALGSNLGDRSALMARAAERLNGDAGTRVAAVSSLYATEPVGLPGAPQFFNAVLELSTRRGPESLLDLCLSIEGELGRVRAGAQASRTIDVDLLLFDDLRMSSPRLCLPHPRMKERAFVLVPLAEIAPGLVLDGRTIEVWAAGADASGVRRLEGHLGWPPSLGL
jgi:2-amino-4-hydroxy-6-hydroxymethyldihydropteridine diphosphokinase